MKIRTFSSQDVAELDKLVNEFEETHTVRATQTRTIGMNGIIVHYYTVFYIPQEGDVL